MTKAKDQNDRLVDGTLPTDPEADTDPVQSQSRVRASTVRLVDEVEDTTTLPVPSDVHAEAALLATLLWSAAYAPTSLTPAHVADLLEQPAAFYSAAHREIFTAVTELHAAGTPPTVVAVHSDLLRKGTSRRVGGIEYLEQLVASAAPTSEHALRSHAQSIRDTWVRRELVLAARKIDQAARASKTSVADALESAQAILTGVAKTATADASFVHMGACLSDITRGLSGGNPEATRTGILGLDALMPALAPEEVTILAARTSVGKSALATQIAMNIASATKPGGVFYASLEMAPQSFSMRVLSARARVPLTKLLERGLSADEMARVVAEADKINRLPIYFAQKAQQSMGTIRGTLAKLRVALADRHHLKFALIVIDHVGLVMARSEARNQPREQQVAEVSRGLRYLAGEFKCHVIGLAQIARESERQQGKNKIPQLHHIRESGALEQDPDNVWILHREFDEHRKPIPGRPSVLSIQKGRMTGAGKSVFLRCEPEYVTFSEWND